MKISVDLSKNEAERLEKTAKRLGVPPEDLARAAMADVLGHPPEDFQRVAEQILEKNKELYRRLS